VPLTLDESYFRAAAWLGSDQFDAALIQTPCGCELAEKAQREPDPSARKVLSREASDAQRGWCCPHAGHALRPLPAVEHGTLVTLQGLPAVLHEAAYACAAGRAERYEYEQRVREQKQKAASGG
jgi:hypothetical protein